MKPTNRRKLYFIDPKFQKTVLFYTIVLVSIILVINYAVHLLFFENLLNVGKDFQLPSGHSYFKFVKDQKVILDQYFLIMSIVLSILTILTSVYFSHRIAGPIYRIKNYFKDELPDKGIKVKIRKGDFFQELPDEINDFFNRKE